MTIFFVCSVVGERSGMRLKDSVCPNCGKPKWKRSSVCSDCSPQSGSSNGNWRGGVSTNNYRYKLHQKEKFPERVRARDLLIHAVMAGRVLKESCRVCGELKSEAHHEDYARPLDVVWLCRTHHRELHLEKSKRAG